MGMGTSFPHILVAQVLAGTTLTSLRHVDATSLLLAPPISEPKFGYCPTNPAWNPAICKLIKRQLPQDGCLDDSSCPGVQKCCTTESCSPRCEEPTCTIPVAGGKPGLCPKPQKDANGLCWDKCQADSDCVGRLKCCSNGCGHECMLAY
ncbi:hypothetical protein BV898_13021 [Hypsibius exemplaris]|uniref:WAP domain-containing protein n=1 Tax=Hypsibius exemplaris TaxID=2072580 RepID=A0A1W0WBZ5_HYPEX|nr:hypothetical protein BV898_13021 [Hypsibius exemplaris]